MTVIEVRTGLRRLDFGRSDPDGGDSAKKHVIVEFARETELARNQVVRIHLGLRNGIERVLEGLPTLVAAPATAKSREFLYRLEGDVG